MKIKKKNTTIPINGKIVDTENVEDKTSNAPSMRLTQEMIKEKYSTDEQVIGTWIDGKPLYRKVIEMGNMTKEDYKIKAHNIQNIKYARIVDFVMQRGTQSSSNFQLFSVGNVGGKYNDTQVGFDTYMDTSNIYVYCTGDRTLFVGTAIIEYTKTTD